MSCKLTICVVIRVDSIATEENTMHIYIALQFPFVLLYFPWEAFDFYINVEFLINLLK